MPEVFVRDDPKRAIYLDILLRDEVRRRRGIVRFRGEIEGTDMMNQGTNDTWQVCELDVPQALPWYKRILRRQPVMDREVVLIVFQPTQAGYDITGSQRAVSYVNREVDRRLATE
jgi:hypothetical protein